jgi:hypothetical protein
MQVAKVSKQYIYPRLEMQRSLEGREDSTGDGWAAVGVAQSSDDGGMVGEDELAERLARMSFSHGNHWIIRVATTHHWVVVAARVSPHQSRSQISL